MNVSPIGTIVRLTDASIYSMSIYNAYKNKGLRLLCPCKIPKNLQLVVVDKLSMKLALLSPYHNRKLLAVLPWADLDKF